MEQLRKMIEGQGGKEALAELTRTKLTSSEKPAKTSTLRASKKK